MSSLRTPLSTLQSSEQRERPAGASFSGMWTGRVAYVHRDIRGRIKFLFDIVPLSGWPAASEDIAGATSGARIAALRGVARVRMRQAFMGNLRDLAAPPTGIVCVPEVGSLVSVEMDEAGWIITGFHTGPIVAADGSVAALNEVGFNPGIEEAQPAINDDTRIPWLFGVEEGDIILGRGDSRVKLRKEGVFIGSSVQCLHLYKSDSGEMFERYVQMERRAAGRMSYHKILLGVNSKAQKTSVIELPATDALVVNTDVIESSPYFKSNKSYHVMQRGHVTKSTCDLGRMAGEILPTPSEVMNETTQANFTVMRDTVVKPTAEPTGTNADVNELQSTSSVVFDKQVGADGSFHIRAGNLPRKPGASQLGQASQLDFELAFDAKTQDFVMKVMQGGQETVAIKFNGLSGIASFEAANVLRLKAKQVIIEADASISLSTPGALTLSGSNMQLDQAGTLKVMQEILAGVISLTKHTHPYTDDGSPSITALPVP